MCGLVLENGDPSIKLGPTPRYQGTSFYGHNSRMRQEQRHRTGRRFTSGGWKMTGGNELPRGAQQFYQAETLSLCSRPYRLSMYNTRLGS